MKCKQLSHDILCMRTGDTGTNNQYLGWGNLASRGHLTSERALHVVRSLNDGTVPADREHIGP
jgi:hypothetical protein